MMNSKRTCVPAEGKAEATAAVLRLSGVLAQVGVSATPAQIAQIAALLEKDAIVGSAAVAPEGEASSMPKTKIQLPSTRIKDQHAHGHDLCGIQCISPAIQMNSRSPKEIYAPPSITVALKPGQRVDSFDLGPHYTVQKLTDRSYWMIANAFTTLAYVGDESVLLVDAPGSLNPTNLLAEIAKFTDLPVSTLVYSHAHVDHNGGSHRLKSLLDNQGIDLRIVGSEQLVSEVTRYKEGIMYPTDVVKAGNETFAFEKWEFKLVTPVNTAHSCADSYVLTPDKVVKYVDFNYPGRLPLAYISSSQSITGWIEFLRHVSGEDWVFADLGHANVGCKRDIDLTFEYMSDLYDAFATIIAPSWARGEYFEPGLILDRPDYPAGLFWGNFVDLAAETMAEAVFPKWKEIEHSEVIRSHAYKVLEDAFLNYNVEQNPDVRPDFAPITPAQRAANMK